MPLLRRALRAALIVLIFGLPLVVPASPKAQAPRTVQDGVFSDTQATRGQALYAQRCAGCHGPALAGAQGPPLEGAAFRSKWSQEPLSALFIKIRYTMPPGADDAARLTPDQGADLVAHVLKSNGFPAGKTEFAAADAVTSTVGWPGARAADAPAVALTRYAPTGTLNQLMRGVFFPNSNLIFSIQEREAKDLPPQPNTSKPEGVTIFEWGQMVYTGWPVVENASTALADASALMLQPGLRCENGRLAPNAEPDWIRFTDQMIAVARRSYRLAQARDKDALSDYTADLSNACNACHSVYRDVGGRGRGRGGNAAGPATGASARCTHR